MLCSPAKAKRRYCVLGWPVMLKLSIGAQMLRKELDMTRESLDETKSQAATTIKSKNEDIALLNIKIQSMQGACVLPLYHDHLLTPSPYTVDPLYLLVEFPWLYDFNVNRKVIPSLRPSPSPRPLSQS